MTSIPVIALEDPWRGCWSRLAKAWPLRPWYPAWLPRTTGRPSSTLPTFLDDQVDQLVVPGSVLRDLELIFVDNLILVTS